MCFNFFKRRKEEALKKAKQLEKEKIPSEKDIKSEDKKLDKKEKKLKKLFKKMDKVNLLRSTKKKKK